MVNPRRVIEVAVVIGTLLVAAISLGVYDVLFNFEENRCQMTYMFEYPTYIPIKLDQNIQQKHPNYGLYVYAEGERVGYYLSRLERNQRFAGIPLLFIPGNAGSHKQARSLGSVLLRMAQKRQFRPHFDIFTVDLNEELAALYGGFLQQQTEFIRIALRRIASLYDQKKGQKVLIVGHSVGGMIARGLFTFSDVGNDLVDTVITLSTPHQPIVAVDEALHDYYKDVNEYWIRNINTTMRNVVLLSLAGGHRDILVRSERSDLTPLLPNHPRIFSIATTAVPSVWASTDHLSIVWCKQLVLTISRALFAMREQNIGRISESVERRTEVIQNVFFDIHFSTRETGVIQLKNIPKRISESLDTTITVRRYEGPFYQVIPTGNLTGNVLIRSNFWADNFIFVCPDSTCAQLKPVENRPMRIPWFSEDGAYITRISHSSFGDLEDGNLVLDIPKRDDQLEIDLSAIGSFSDGYISFWDGFKDSTRAELSNTRYFRLNVSLTELWQALYITVKTEEGCKEKRGVVRFHVPGFPQDTYRHIDSGVVTVMAKLQSERVDVGDPFVEFHLNGNCRYEFVIGVSWMGIFGQIVRFYVFQLPAFLAAVVVLRTIGLYSDRNVGYADHVVPQLVVAAAYSISKYLPVRYQTKLGFFGSSFWPSLVIWIAFYGFAQAFVSVICIAVNAVVKVYSYPVFYLSKPFVFRLQSIRDRLPNGFQKALIFPLFFAFTTGLAVVTCGENALLLSLVLLFTKMCYLKRNADLSTGPREDIREHTQLFLLALLTCVINAVPTIVWLKRIPSNFLSVLRKEYTSIDPDPSFTVSLLVGLTCDLFLQWRSARSLSSASSKVFDAVARTVIYLTAAGLLLYAQHAFFMMNAILKMFFAFLSVDILRRVFLPNA